MDRQAIIQGAALQAGALVDGVGTRALAQVAEMAGAGPDMLRALLAHELVAGHAVMMRLAAKVDHFLALIAADRPAAEQDRGCRQAVQLSGAAARLSERYRQGLMSLARLKRWAGAAPARPRPADGLDDDGDDDPFPEGPGGGTRKSPAKVLAELAALNKSMGAMLDGHKRNGAKPGSDGNGVHLDAADRPHPEPVERRGRLRHGNPSGDFLAAPRCGARTRAGGACRQPAMANGRCRLHGGTSTGARTAAGLARCRAARLVHGERTAEIIDLKSAAARHGRALRALARAGRRLATQSPRSERSTPCPATPSDHVPAAAAPPAGLTRGGRPAVPPPARLTRSTPGPAAPDSAPPPRPRRRRTA